MYGNKHKYMFLCFAVLFFSFQFPPRSSFCTLFRLVLVNLYRFHTLLLFSPTETHSAVVWCLALVGHRRYGFKNADRLNDTDLVVLFSWKLWNCWIRDCLVPDWVSCILGSGNISSGGGTLKLIFTFLKLSSVSATQWAALLFVSWFYHPCDITGI